jgi:hypothetical protein
MKRFDHKINDSIDWYVNKNLNYSLRDYFISYTKQQVEYNIRRIISDRTNIWFTMHIFQIKEKLENYELSLDK